MAVYTWVAPNPDCSTTTNFNTFVADFNAQMLAIGLVRTSHTGQMDTSSVVDVTVGSGNGSSIYYLPLIYTFSDSLIPTFIKIYFQKFQVRDSGSQATATLNCLIQISNTLNSDGSQVTGGYLQYFTALLCYSNPAAGPVVNFSTQNSYIQKASDGSSFTLVHSPGYTAYNGHSNFSACIGNKGTIAFIHIERTTTKLNAIGPVNATGNAAFGSPVSPIGLSYQQFGWLSTTPFCTSMTTTATALGTDWFLRCYSAGNLGVVNNTIQCQPILLFSPDGSVRTSTAAVSYKAAVSPIININSVSLNGGTSKNFLFMGTVASGAVFYNKEATQTPESGIAFLYE